MLAEEISREQSVQALAWILLTTLILVYSKREQNDGKTVTLRKINMNKFKVADKVGKYP